jgi:hypothetical protein
MVARVRDPIDGWGGGQAPMHQVKSSVARHHYRATTQAKGGARTCTTKSGGGGDEGIFKPPPAKYSHPRYDPPSPTCAAVLQKP